VSNSGAKNKKAQAIKRILGLREVGLIGMSSTVPLGDLKCVEYYFDTTRNFDPVSMASMVAITSLSLRP
jgi:hypothetical protein